jgi:hypothetical protein
MLKIMGLASAVLLLGIGTAAATSDTSDKRPVAKNSQFLMLAEQGRRKRDTATDYDPSTCPTKKDPKTGKIITLCDSLQSGSPGPTNKPQKPTTQGNVNR